MTWEVGQRCVIDRRTLVSIERVTPSGHAAIGDRTFDVSGGRERGAYGRARLEALTPEIEAEMALDARARAAARATDEAIMAAGKWLRNALSTFGHRTYEAADVDRAERLNAAIRRILEMPNA